MSEQKTMSEWEFLIGYPLDEAEEILREEAVAYTIKRTAAPFRDSSGEELYVIAVRSGNPLCLICASPDWEVN